MCGRNILMNQASDRYQDESRGGFQVDSRGGLQILVSYNPEIWFFNNRSQYCSSRVDPDLTQKDDKAEADPR
jgi:hypothetical protein